MIHKQRKSEDLVQLPLMGNVAIYSKIATREKVYTQDRQEETLIQFANELGYDAAHVTTFTDEGTTAAAPLMERQGYTALLQAISKGDISVLLVSDVSRLLADATELQINTFIHLCMSKGVFVVTSQTTFDFSNLTLVHLFRSQCTSAFAMLVKATP